jgi:hypothetical protein
MTFWPGVLLLFESRGGSAGRSPQSLRNKWCEVQNAVQKWLRAKKLVEDANLSGTTPEDIERITQEKYRLATGKNTKDGTRKLGRLFRMHAAAEYLKRSPKFDPTYVGTSANVPGYRRNGVPTPRKSEIMTAIDRETPVLQNETGELSDESGS